MLSLDCGNGPLVPQLGHENACALLGCDGALLLVEQVPGDASATENEYPKDARGDDEEQPDPLPYCIPHFSHSKGG